MKKCNKCGVEKSLDNFFNDKSKKDGKTTICKTCKYEGVIEYNIKNREKINNRARKLYKTNQIKKGYIPKQRIVIKTCPTCTKEFTARNGIDRYCDLNCLVDKYCAKCGTIKPKKDYDINNRRFDKLAVYCKSCTSKIGSESRRKERLEVLEILGNGDIKCACCSERNYEFLAIDHIHGGGNKHIESIKNRNLANWIKKNNYPEGFRILCHNCNFSLGTYKFCPHENL